jgi:hypothetical protein
MTTASTGVPEAARVLVGGFIHGEDDHQVRVGQRQVVDGAGAPVGQPGHPAVGEGELIHLWCTTVGAAEPDDSVPESRIQSSV